MLNNNKAFTLIEVVVAVFIMTMGVGSVYILVNQASASSRLASSKLAAIHLAQEGIEIVRSIRDGNFLKVRKGVSGANWSDGLINCASGCEVDFNDGDLAAFQNRYLKIDGGFYQYSDSGISSPFKRKITIAPGADVLDISVEVFWQDKGITHKVAGQEFLYQWLK